MARIHAWVFGVALLSLHLAHAQPTPSPFHPLTGVGDAHPELADVVATARELAASDETLDARRVQRARHGHRPTLDEARAERAALIDALRVLSDLELLAAAAADFDRANDLRAARDGLIGWINAGLAHHDEDGLRPPRLATPTRPADGIADVAALRNTADVSYGFVAAAVALTRTLAMDLRAHGPAAPAGTPAQTAEAASLRADLDAATRDQTAERLLRAAAAADPERAHEAAQGEATLAQLEEARAQALARAQRLAAQTAARLEQANPVTRMLLGEALLRGEREAETTLRRSGGAEILARRARGPYLFMVFVDGLDPDVLTAAAARDDAQGRPELPWFRRLLAESASFQRVFGVFPSVTIANTITLSTGSFPERTGVPSNAVFERATRTWTRFLGARTSRNVDNDVPVSFLHEHFPERDRFTPLMPAQRGVSSSVFAFPAVIGHLFRVGWPDGIFLDTVRKAYGKGDGKRGDDAWLPPRCVTLYLGWYDYVAHDAPLGGHSLEAFEQLQKYDTRLARLERDQARLGIGDLTYTVLFSDHGMISAPGGHGNQTVHLGRELEALGLPINDGAVDNGNGPEQIQDDSDVGAVADVAGNGSIGLYFRHGDAGATWADRNLTADLRSYGLPTGERIDLLAHLAGLDGVNLTLARESARACRVIGAAGEAIVRWEPGADGVAVHGRFAYRVVAGQDPLKLGELADDELRDGRAWLALTADHRYPAAPFQIGQAFAANLDLDVTLCAEPGFNFTAGDHQLHSDHGFLDRASIRTALFVRGPDVAPGPIDTPAYTVDLVPTVLDLAGVSPSADADGRSLAPLLRPQTAGLIDGLGH